MMDNPAMVLALGERDAAASLGISQTVFRDLVNSGHLPKPRKVPERRRNVWDIDELRACMRCWQREGEQSSDADDLGEEWC